MPGKSPIFTPSSILFRPHHQPPHRRFVVEAPGTAPGSEWLITSAVYRHSQQADLPNIRISAAKSKRGIDLVFALGKGFAPYAMPRGIGFVAQANLRQRLDYLEELITGRNRQ